MKIMNKNSYLLTSWMMSNSSLRRIFITVTREIMPKKNVRNEINVTDQDQKKKSQQNKEQVLR